MVGLFLLLSLSVLLSLQVLLQEPFLDKVVLLLLLSLCLLLLHQLLELELNKGRVIARQLIGIDVETMAIQLVEDVSLLRLLGLVDPLGDAHMRWVLVDLRIRGIICGALLILLLGPADLENGADGFIGNLLCLHLKRYVRVHLLLLEAAHVGLVKQLDHVEKVWLGLLDFININV